LDNAQRLGKKEKGKRKKEPGDGNWGWIANAVLGILVSRIVSFTPPPF